MLRNDLLRNYLTDGIEDCQLLRCRFSSQRQNDERKEGLLDTKVRGARGCRDINKGEEREEEGDGVDARWCGEGRGEFGVGWWCGDC